MVWLFRRKHGAWRSSENYAGQNKLENFDTSLQGKMIHFGEFSSPIQ